MVLRVVLVLLSAVVISLSSYLSKRYPSIAGFVVALPLSTMLVLVMSRIEHKGAVDSFAFARSILVAIPISCLFLVPFLFAERIGLPFWGAYVAGIVLLAAGYFVHRAIAG